MIFTMTNGLQLDCGAVHDKQNVEHIECATIPLRESLPRDFSRYYEPEVYANEKNINEIGRPKHTDRNLVDWGLNDVRSLLFRPEKARKWPKIQEPGFHIVSLPLDASDDVLVDILAHSDLFKEHKWLTVHVRSEIAAHVVHAAREASGGNSCLTLPQWRHMVEEYMLNLACQVQCRLDFRKSLSQLKQTKSEIYGSDTDSCSPPELQPEHVTVEERCRLWRSCQKALYNRLNLDWKLDQL